MESKEIFDKVSKIIAETFIVEQEAVNRETVAIDIPGWDSLSYIILLSNIEEEFEKEMNLEEVTFNNVGELVDFIANELQ